MPDCKVCSHPKSEEIMSRVFQGELSYTDAAKILNLPVPTVWHCFKNHWEVLTSREGTTLKLKEAESIDDYITILKTTIEKLVNAINDPSSLTPQGARTLTLLSKETRGLMRDILEFEGKLSTGIVVKYNVLQIQMNKLTSFLFSKLTPEQVQILMNELPELMEGTQHEPNREITKNT